MICRETDPRIVAPLRPSSYLFSANRSYRRILSSTLGIDALVRRNGLEFLFTQIPEEILDSPMVPGVVGVLALGIVVGQSNTHRIERWTARLLIFWSILIPRRRRVSTTVVSKVHWIVICRCSSVSAGTVHLMA